MMCIVGVLSADPNWSSACSTSTYTTYTSTPPTPPTPPIAYATYTSYSSYHLLATYHNLIPYTQTKQVYLVYFLLWGGAGTFQIVPDCSRSFSDPSTTLSLETCLA